MRRKIFSAALVLMTAGFSSCAEAGRTTPAKPSAAMGAAFDGVGKVTWHRGQPCTPQIMFDFRAERSTSIIWLSIDAKQERLLIDAANKRRRAHVSGKWRRGKSKECNYVSVTAVEVQKSFWQR